MKLLEFMERGGAMLDRMAAVALDDMRATRDAGDHDLTDEELEALSQRSREQLRIQMIGFMREHGIPVHDDFAAPRPANDNKLAVMAPQGRA